MFRLVLITVITLMQAYVFWRLLQLPWLRRAAGRRTALFAGAALWLIFFYARSFKHSDSAPPAAFMELFGMDWMGCVFLLFSCLFIVELATGFGLFFKRYQHKLRAAGLCVGLLFSLIAVVQGLRPPAVTDYEVRLASLPPERDGTVIAVATDMHLGSLLGAKWLAARVDEILALKPDLIALVGDIYDGRSVSSDEFVDEFSKLRAPLGVWVVLGNHENYTDKEKHIASFGLAGFRLLRDENALAAPGLVLAGVDDLTIKQHFASGLPSLEKAFANRPPGAAVLLSHSPLLAEEASKLGAGLMLSGHTHNGQIWPFTYLARSRYPFVSGAYSVGEMTIIVCRGTGTWGPRMRLFQRGEILRVTLRAKA